MVNKILHPGYDLRYRYEKYIVEKEFSFLSGSFDHKKLTFEGTFTIPYSSIEYDVQISLRLPEAPKVFILNPKIEYSSKIHVYKDTSLCLYYPKDNSWTINSTLAETIIPWTSEWLVFYELYKLKGKWLGKYKTH